MRVAKTKAEITNGNPRKEQGEDGNRLAYDISVEFLAPRQVVDELFPVDGFTAQFFNGEDTRLECIYPITYAEKIEDLRVTLDTGLKPMKFDAAKIARGMKITPQLGGYCKIDAKLQVYPTRDQAGRLDEAVKESVELAIDEMTGDLLEAVA